MDAHDDPTRTLHLTDPKALRAVAHPVRLELLGLLRMHGPLTASEAGRLIGESSGSCSFHLRQLARYGFIEEAGGGRGRQKPWRATTQAMSWADDPDTPELRTASEQLNRVLVEKYFSWIARWLGRSADESPAWRRAASVGDAGVYLTPAELTKLNDQIRSLLSEYDDRTRDPKTRPRGSRLVTFISAAFPMDLAKGGGTDA